MERNDDRLGGTRGSEERIRDTEAETDLRALSGDDTLDASDTNDIVRHDDTPSVGDEVGEAAGGISGALAGAALGSLGGPVGTVIGGIAGAVSGWWAGRTVSEAAKRFTHEDDARYRSEYESSDAAGGRSYDDVRPAYQLGHIAAQNPDYADREFEQIEPDLRSGWSADLRERHGDWADVRGFARDAYARGREARLLLSEEELAIGKRQVQAGEVGVRKTVETERVQERVPVSREEVTVERRPLEAGAGTDVQIGEDEIRIPVVREELVVEKRVVPTEEVVIRKRAVTEERTVEADVRRERVDVDDGAHLADVDRSVERGGERGGEGLADRGESLTERAGDATRRSANKLSDALGNTKDRIDGDPTTRPGPDAQDPRA